MEVQFGAEAEVRNFDLMGLFPLSEQDVVCLASSVPGLISL